MNEMKLEIINKLSENQKEIQEMREEFRALKHTVTDVEKATDVHAERLDDIETNKLPDLKSHVEQKVKDLEEKLVLLEIHDRKQNLLFYNVEENENEDLEDKMKNVWQDSYGLTDDQIERVILTNCHRLPQPRHSKPVNGKLPPRPVIVRFAYASDRAHLGNIKNMKKGSKIRVRDDLPPAMKQERGRLASIAYRLRTEQQKQTRIRVIKTRVILEYKSRDSPPHTNWTVYVG